MSQSVRPNIVRDPTPGYRANVAICVADFASGKVLGFQRCDHCSWQFPQGGVDHGETPVEAAFRELYEETGITSDAVELLRELKGWVHYDWPKKRQREKRAMGATNWKGQRQKWFLMKARSIVEVECCIDLGGLGGAHQEFGHFAWFHIEDMLPLCRDFKRGAYAHVIREMQPLIAARHIAESQQDGQAARSSVELPTVTVNAAELTKSDQSGTCTLVKAVQESTVADVVAELVHRHGHQAVQEALDGMGPQGGNKQEDSESGEETENVQHSLENDVGLRQASQSSLSLSREDTSQ